LSGLTDYALALIHDAILGGVPFSGPPSIEVGLSLAPGSPDGVVVEPPESSGYARVSVPNDLEHFPRATSLAFKTNAHPIVFFEPEGAWDWGLIRSVFLAEPGYSGVSGRVLAFADVRPVLAAFGGGPVTIGPSRLCLHAPAS
jgi:hypothetical protein